MTTETGESPRASWALTESEVDAANEALDDEHKAIATYERAIVDFGPVRPFLNTVEAERGHVEALRRLFDRRDSMSTETSPRSWRRSGSNVWGATGSADSSPEPSPCSGPRGFTGSRSANSL